MAASWHACLVGVCYKGGSVSQLCSNVLVMQLQELCAVCSVLHRGRGRHGDGGMHRYTTAKEQED